MLLRLQQSAPFSNWLQGIEKFYAYGLKGPLGASNVWIVHPSVFILSVYMFVILSCKIKCNILSSDGNPVIRLGPQVHLRFFALQ